MGEKKRQRNLGGTNALVTGGGTGIGRGIALSLAQRGVAVVLCGRRSEPLEETADEVRALGAKAAVCVGDITDGAARVQIVAAARAAFGPLHILVNNAGILAGGGLLQVNGREIEQAVATNLTAPIDLVRLTLADLSLTQGAVVCVGSTMGRVPLPYASIYSAGKGGQHAFCTALGYELYPQGVHLLEVFPPTVDTAMTRGMGRRAGRFAPCAESAEVAGERIVRALETGQSELAWGAGERLLATLHRWAPGMLRAVLSTQRRRFAHVMTPEPHEGTGND